MQLMSQEQNAKTRKLILYFG